MILIITFLLSSIFILLLLVTGFFWKPLKLFFHQDNYTYFDICFLCLYFIEQVFFIIISYFYKEYNILLTGLFALIVITTVSAQKIMMESKNKKIAEMSTRYIEKMKLMKSKYEKQIVNLRDYIEILEEDNPYLNEQD